MVQELTPKEKENILNLFNYINLRLDAGNSEDVIEKKLIELGLSQEKARVYIEAARVRRKNEISYMLVKEEQRRKGLNKMVIGGLIFLIGGIVTLVTYLRASGGGSYVLCYGALIVGAINFIIGLSQWLE